MQVIKNTYISRDGQLNIELEWNGQVVFVEVTNNTFAVHSSGLLKVVENYAVNKVVMAQEI